MAVFNFKTTEDSTPGGGVVKLPDSIRTGNTWKIFQSSYPEFNLSTMTENNFFKRTTCNGSETAGVYNNNPYCLIDNEYHGGSTSISCSYSNGTLSVTINETRRRCKVNKFQGDDGSSEKYDSFTHTLYMSKDTII